MKKSKKQITFTELIDETINYYEKKGRSVQLDWVEPELRFVEKLYNIHPETGRKCSVVRCFKKRNIELLKKRQGSINFSISRLEKYFKKSINKLVKTRYQSITKDQWEVIENIHDTSSYWTSGKFNEEGRTYILQEIKKYINKYYSFYTIDIEDV